MKGWPHALRASLLGTACLLAPSVRADGPATGRVTDEADCARCHPTIASAWRETSMARALGPVLPGELDGLDEVVDPVTGLRYRFDVAGERARVTELGRGDVERGGRPYRRSEPIAFAIGAGLLDRSFAVQRGGRLWFAPLEVVSERIGAPARAALAPPHSMRPALGFSHPITRECLSCHTDRPPPADFPQNTLPASADWQPQGISCAACHGDVDGHAVRRLAEEAGTEPEGEDPVIHPARLSRSLEMSVCAACHLQGDARIELDAREVLGPPPPGGDILDERAVFVAAEPGEDVGFVSHVERLVLSACYLESREMSCTSCHDPHRSLENPRERERVRAACLDCHADAEAAMQSSGGACGRGRDVEVGERDCVACHMRETPVFDVAEVRIHDHWIRARPGPPSEPGPLRFPESPEGGWRRFAWPDASLPEHGDDPGLWLMALSFGGHLERALDFVDREPGARVSRLPMYHHVRGSVLERSGRPGEARAAYERALELDPGLAESRVNLGLLLATQGDPDAGLRWLDGVLEDHPRADTALRNRAVVHRGMGDEEAFLRDLEQAMRLEPRVELARALAEVYARAGQMERARLWAEEAFRLDPFARRER